MHRGADGGLDTLQIDPAAGPAVAENNAQQLIYPADGLFPDRLPRSTVPPQSPAAARRSIH
jgi:hypothetical protein